MKTLLFTAMLMVFSVLFFAGALGRYFGKSIDELTGGMVLLFIAGAAMGMALVLGFIAMHLWIAAFR